MKRYGIVLITINALTVLFLMYLAGYVYGFGYSEEMTLLVPVLPLILSLIYIWRTIKVNDQGLAALKVEKEKLKTIKRIKELHKEIGEE